MTIFLKKHKQVTQLFGLMVENVPKPRYFASRFWPISETLITY